MGQILRLDHRGHGPLVKWQPNDLAEIKTAEEVFNGHLQKGFAMFDISNPDVGKQLTKFEPAVAEILAVPQLQGG